EFGALPAVINSQPGLLIYSGTIPNGVLVIETAGDRISGIRIVVNPRKLLAVPPATTLTRAPQPLENLAAPGDE
ncbi:MAG TPA: hypothetical protein VM536_21435, partial [Chloroflexia bacterium]|nr:hypothetical protein [Chloroflexia bacterium]